MATCYAPGCTAKVPTARLMCSYHWSRVPRPLRDAVYATWNARLRAMCRPGYEAAAEAHERAKRDAAAALAGEG
jgi:hypothetical protein